MKRKQPLKNQAAEQVEKKKPKKPDRGQSLLRFVGPTLIISLFALLAVAIIQYYLIIELPSQKRTDRYLRTTLTSYAELVRLTATGSTEALAVAAQQAYLKQALLSGDQEAIKKQEQLLTSQLPKVLGVRILPADIRAIDPDSVPPITYATLDLVRRVAKGERLFPEVIGVGTPNAHVALIEPIKVENRLIGFLLAGFKLEVINDALTKIQSVPGYLELRQTFGGAVHVLGSHGDPSLKKGEPLSVGRLEGTPWEMAYWPAPSEDFSIYGDTLTFWVAVTAMLLMIAGLGFYGLFRLGKTVQKDAARLLRLILEAKTPHFAVPEGFFSLSIFSDLAFSLSRTGIITVDAASEQDLQQSRDRISDRRIASDAAAESSGDFDDLTSPLLMEDDLDLAAIEESAKGEIAEEIFRAYDIRGVVGDTLTEDAAEQIGRAIGSEAFERGQQTVVVARDGRVSSPAMCEALKRGLMASGRNVIDIGEVPTPVLYFATHFLDANSGVMVTGSHNPPDYNGFKIVLAGESLSGDDIRALYKRIVSGELLAGKGQQSMRDVVPDYIGKIVNDVALAQPLRVVVDCGNGVAANVAPQLLQALGCEVIGLYCTVDGTFPNHHPDPSKPENLQDLIKMVREEKADLGIAFDGDGDRLGVVDSEGEIIWPDTQMMLFSMDLLSRNPGADIIFDVKCSRHLGTAIRGHGGRPIMWKTGHSLIKAKMKETGALLAGERSGHIFFKERWYGFDDALYAAARLLEILAADFRKSHEVFKVFPKTVSTPEINVPVSEKDKFKLVAGLAKVGKFGDGKRTTIDGLRVDYPEGWGLVRASNTTPCLVIRFEADNEAALEKIKGLFRAQIKRIKPDIQLPF